MNTNRKYTKSTPTLNNIETKIFNILTEMKVSFTIQACIDKYNVDFLIEDKYIVEVYGDFWHCNPEKYSHDYFNRGKKKTAEEIWKRDAYRKQKFESMGFKFMSVWESDINNNSKVVRKQIKKMLN